MDWLSWRALSGAFVASLVLTSCAKPGEPLEEQTVIQQSTGVEYQVLTFQAFQASPIQSPRIYYSADNIPTIPHRNVAVALTLTGCRTLESSMTQFVEVTSGQSMSAIVMRRDPRGGGREGALHDPGTESGVLAFRNPALTVESIMPQVEACEQYASDHPGLIQPIFLALVRVEDSDSDIALYDRYVEDVVFAGTHADFGEWATQQMLVGLLLP